MERERQRGRRGLMPGEQKDQHLVAHLLGVHRRAGVQIAGAQQPREEIVATGSGLLPICDQRVDDVVERSPGARSPAVAGGGPGRRRRQRRHRAPERVPVEHRERRVGLHHQRLGHVVAEDRPPDDSQRQLDHLGVGVNARAVSRDAIPAPRDGSGLLGHQLRVCVDLSTGEQRLDEAPLPLPDLAFAGEQSPAEGLRDLLVEPGALRIALARAGQHRLDPIGMEHAVQVEAHAGGSRP